MKYKSVEDFVLNSVGLATVINNYQNNILEIFGAVDNLRLKNVLKEFDSLKESRDNIRFLLRRVIGIENFLTSALDEDFDMDAKLAIPFYVGFKAEDDYEVRIYHSGNLIEPVKNILLDNEIIVLREATLTSHPEEKFSLHESLSTILNFVEAKLGEKKLPEVSYRELSDISVQQSLQVYQLLISLYEQKLN